MLIAIRKACAYRRLPGDGSIEPIGGTLLTKFFFIATGFRMPRHVIPISQVPADSTSTLDGGSAIVFVWEVRMSEILKQAMIKREGIEYSGLESPIIQESDMLRCLSYVHNTNSTLLTIESASQASTHPLKGPNIYFRKAGCGGVRKRCQIS